jgi:hypothetical protein
MSRRRQITFLQLAFPTGMLRGVLFTLAFASVSVGALTVPGTWITRAQVICTGVLLPLPFVAGALLFGARRHRGLNPAFVSVPLGLIVIGTAARLPALRGVPGSIARVLAAPGLTLLGRISPAAGAAVIGAWLAASVWLLSRLDRGNIGLAIGSPRPPRASRLARPGSPGVVLDLVTHQLSLRDAVELIPLTALLAVAAAVATAAGRGHVPPAAVFTVAVLAWPAASVGYRQLRASTALPRPAREWLLAAPVPVYKVPWTRHVVCACGAAASCAIFAGLLASARLAGLPMPLAPLAPIATAPLCLTGWLAVLLSWRGLARLAGYYLLAQYVLLRAAAAVLVYLAHWPAIVVVALLMTDVAVGVAGQFAARLALRRRS